MKCEIGGKIVNAKIVERLGFQGGRYAKTVLYEGEEVVVTSRGCYGPWKQHVASVQIGTGYSGQSNRQIISSCLLMAALCLVAGCIGPSIMYRQFDCDGTKTSEIRLYSPKYASGDSYIISTNGMTEARLSASQDAKGIIGAQSSGRGMIIMYIMCGLITIAGVGMFAAPNHIISNKDALIVCGIGGASFAIVTWVSASASIMAWVLPVALVIVGAYMLWQWKSSL